MKVTVYLADGGRLDWENFDADSALDLRDSLDNGDLFCTFEMGDATVLVNSAHIVRVDLEGPG